MYYEDDYYDYYEDSPEDEYEDDYYDYYEYHDYPPPTRLERFRAWLSFRLVCVKKALGLVKYDDIPF